MNRSVTISVLGGLLFMMLPVAAFPGAALTPEFGFVSPSVTGDSSGLGVSANTGFKIGLNFRLDRDNFLFQPGILFQDFSMDYRYMDYINTELVPGSISVQSWQFPILLGYRIGQGERLAVDLLGGLVLDLMSNNENPNQVPPEAFKSAIWSTRIGADIGIGDFVVGAYYDFSLSEIFKTHVGGDEKINRFNGSAGYRIPL